MKRGALAVLGACVVASCLPSTDEFAKGSSDAGATSALDAGTAEASVAVGADGGGTDAGGALFQSCKDILAATPGAEDGFFPSANGEIYCDMTTDGGGWTLVGRSQSEDSDDANQPFGWSSVSGDIHDPNHPYSFGVLTRSFDFSEVLVGMLNQPTDMPLGKQVFKLELTKDELTQNANSNFGIDAVSTVRGGCNPPGGPSMLSRAGYSTSTDQFHFRDVGGDMDDPTDQYGLLWYGFETNYPNCNEGGNIEHDEGEVYVR